jgi:hypothetical protein
MWIADAANVMGQEIGKVAAKLCPTKFQYQQALTQCRAFAKRYFGTAVGADIFGQLQSYVDFCENQAQPASNNVDASSPSPTAIASAQALLSAYS